MKIAKNMILKKESNSAAFVVKRKKNLVVINYYEKTSFIKQEQLSLDIGSKKYYTLLDKGYTEVF